MITPCSPTAEQIDLWVPTHLFSAGAYKLDQTSITTKVDQNESPWDWPEDMKQRVVDKVMSVSWNRYPSPYPVEIINQLSQTCEIDPECIVVGQGSNTLIALALSAFGHTQVVAADPSFPLYKAHCRYAGLPYEPWPLDTNFEYDLKLLPPLKPGGIVVFASPNNPTGSLLKDEDLHSLLSSYPKTLFIADEAYLGFSSQNLSYLLKDFSNLILIRTLSKTAASAGIRCGYTLGHPTLVEQIRKINLPFSSNIFTSFAIEALLTDKEFIKKQKSWTATLLQEKSVLISEMKKHLSSSAKLYPGHANFVMIQFKNDDNLNMFNNHLKERQILARAISDGQRLKGCLRLSIGTPEENKAIIKACQKFSGTR
ncbi:MAG: histidinol-phosphate transaminase [Oligoflexales bacterium]